MPIEVTAPTPRPMLVVVLADTSGSMAVDGKITVLNDAVSRMVDAFSQLQVPGCELIISAISFGFVMSAGECTALTLKSLSMPERSFSIASLSPKPLMTTFAPSAASARA